MSRAGSVRQDDFQPGITRVRLAGLARFAEMNFQPGFGRNDHSANDLDHFFPVISGWLFFCTYAAGWVTACDTGISANRAGPVVM